MKTSDITLVFQGAFKPYVTREHDDVARNIKLTRKVLPGARIVLSTWSGAELPSGLAVDAVVQSPDPGGLPPLKLDDRSLFVVGPDGRVSYVAQPFKQLSPKAYDDLAAAVDALAAKDAAETKTSH